MIGRQMWWMISFVSWLPIYFPWLMVIVWNGGWQIMGILLSALFTISYMDLLPLLFHGKVFRRLSHPGVSLSSFGQPHGIGSSREISWDLRVFISLTGVLCVIAVIRHWIICCYIVGRLISFGVLFLGFLGSLGFPLVWWEIFYLVGGLGWGSIHPPFGT